MKKTLSSTMAAVALAATTLVGCSSDEIEAPAEHGYVKIRKIEGYTPVKYSALGEMPRTQMSAVVGTDPSRTALVDGPSACMNFLVNTFAMTGKPADKDGVCVTPDGNVAVHIVNLVPMVKNQPAKAAP